LPQTPQPVTLLDALALQDGPSSALTFLHTDETAQVLTRSQFRAVVQRCAGVLQQQGVGPRDLVIIADTQSIVSIVAFWGALWLGAIPSMFPTLTEKLDPQIYMRNMAELVERSQVRAVLADENFVPLFRQHTDAPVLALSTLVDVDPADSPTNLLPYAANPDDIAFLQHSSGTTGLQKGIALSHTAALNQLTHYSAAIDLREQDVIVSWLPLYHDMGLVAGFLLPLVRGIPLVLMSPFAWVAHPAMLLRAIHRYQGTLCWLPNFAYNHCARRIRERDIEGVSLASMRAFINCSEPVRHESHALFVEKFAPLGVTWNQISVCYAMAENTFAVTQTPIGQPPLTEKISRRALESDLCAVRVEDDDANGVTIVSCGLPITNVDVQVWNAEKQPLPERSVGEIAIHSDSMLSGYYRRPDLTPLNEAGWYATGDRGYIADGQVFIIGRSKDLIINAGKNIYPQDIEAIANTVAGIHPGRAVVFGVSDEREGTELLALIAEVSATDEAERKKIVQALRQSVVSQAEVTLTYVALVESGWLIKTSSGKIARGENRTKWQQTLKR
jgi:fatty-acyl-CoA synthase